MNYIKRLNRLSLEVWLLSITCLTYYCGISFLWPFHMLYINQYQNKSLFVAGTILLIHFAAQVLGNFLGGRLFDRWSYTSPLLFSSFISLPIVFIIWISNNFYVYAVLMMPLGFCYGVFFSNSNALMAMISKNAKNGITVLYMALNLGGGIGTALGGLIADRAMNDIFLYNSFAYILFIILFLFTIHKIKYINRLRQKINRSGAPNRKIINNRRIYKLLILGFTFFLIQLSYMQWMTVMPVIFESQYIPLSSYSILWTINAFVIVGAQPFIMFIINRCSISLHSQVMIGVIFLCISNILLLTSHEYLTFVISIIMLTLGEMFAFPGIPSLAEELAPINEKGKYQGVVTGGATLGRMVAPIIGGSILGSLGTTYVLLFMSVISLIPVIIFSFHKMKPGIMNEISEIH